MNLKFKKYLESRNATEIVVEDTTIEFKIGELNVLFEYDRDDDPNYFRISLPNIENKEFVEDACDKVTDINSTFKCSKIIKDDGNWWISIEQLIYEQYNDYKLFDLFDRIIKILKDTLEAYRNYENK